MDRIKDLDDLMRRRWLVLLLIIGFVLVVDQVTKRLITLQPVITNADESKRRPFL